jgi:hypothetical protein
MRTRPKPVVTSLAAAFVLAAFVATASAQRFETSNQGIRATFAELRFGTIEEIEGRCPVTVEGTFHSRTIAKNGESLVGYITRGILNRSACMIRNV